MTGLQLAVLGLCLAAVLFLACARYANVADFRHVNSGNFLRSVEWRIARRYVFEACGRRCGACGTSRGLNIDHVLPRGRRHDLALDITNLQVLCWRCNKAKGGSRTDYRTRQQRVALVAAAAAYKAFIIELHKRKKVRDDPILKPK